MPAAPEAGLTIETLAWILFAGAVLALCTRQGRLAFGLGLPALCLAGAESFSAASSGVLPPALPTFAPVFAACLGWWVAQTRRNRGATHGQAAALPYPDLPHDCAGEPLGRWDGDQWDRLSARLADLTREFLAHVVPRPGRPPKVDIRDPEVGLVIDGILGAADLVVGASGGDEPQTLAVAIRDLERRWLMICNRGTGRL